MTRASLVLLTLLFSASGAAAQKIEAACTKAFRDLNLEAWCVSWATDKEFTTVDAADLGVGSRKYNGKPVRLTSIQCYYADVEDYRCVAGSTVSIFTKSIEPGLVQSWVEEHCGQLKTAVTSSKCRLSIRFRFSGDDVNEDIISGYRQRIVITPEKIEAIMSKPRG